MSAPRQTTHSPKMNGIGNETRRGRFAANDAPGLPSSAAEEAAGGGFAPAGVHYDQLMVAAAAAAEGTEAFIPHLQQ